MDTFAILLLALNSFMFGVNLVNGSNRIWATISGVAVLVLLSELL